MKQKTKKLIGISSGLIAIAILFMWYFSPFLEFQWFYYTQVGTFQKELEVAPIYIDHLIEPPHEWNDINIGELSLKLPNTEYKRVDSDESCVYFISDSRGLIIRYTSPEEEFLKKTEEKNINYPIISYQDRVSMLKSVPTDVSIFHTRGKNMEGFSNQILKFISIPTGGLSESLIIDPKVLKAICLISEKRENGYSALAEIYSNNEAIPLNITLIRYNEKRALKRDLLRILASIKVPNHPLDIEVVRKDIDALSEKYRNMIGITH